MLRKFLITGGAGFMGSSFIRYLLKHSKQLVKIVNLDLLTYAANLQNLDSVYKDPRYVFIQGDICCSELIRDTICRYEIDTIVHFAAQTHVDRSIEDPYPFLKTNIEGTYTLLEAVKRNRSMRFHHISTDEVYGSTIKGYCKENSAYRPNSPYAASKAASDHLVRSYIQTYGIQATISHSANNYGPGQFREKFIPAMIACCIEKTPFPIYGDGKNIRNWLYVDDHAEAVYKILLKGGKSQVYNIASKTELSNLELLHRIIDLYCSITGEQVSTHIDRIKFVNDRKGHDFRYGIDSCKIRKDLLWKENVDLKAGLIHTIKWVLKLFSAV